MTAELYAQADMGHRFMQADRPLFNMDAVTLLGDTPDKALVLVYVDIRYEDLTFVRSGRGFEASYEIDLSVLAGKDDNAPRVTNKLWKQTVVVSSFEETNNTEKLDVSQQQIELPPGTYLLVASFTDLESKDQFTLRQTLDVPTYGLGGLELSDLIVSRRVRLAEDGTIEIVPNVDHKVFSSRAPIFIYYEVYPYSADSLDVYARVLDKQGEIVRELTQKRAAMQPVTRDFLKIEIEDLPVGRYVFEMQVSANGRTALKGTSFRIQLAGVPGTVQDLDLAIRQLRYITKNSQLKRLSKAEGKEREELFQQFWKERDPTPETDENELMEEYYGRIARANDLFGTFRDGWETDMGEVYVRFGPPSEVERHPFETDERPYEIWYYYNLQRRFIFVDEMGYGEYRLVTNLWR